MQQVKWREGDIERFGTLVALYKGKCRIRPHGHQNQTIVDLKAHQIQVLEEGRWAAKAYRELNS